MRRPGGSSPLARGLPLDPVPDGGYDGIIPARAGFTVDKPELKTATGDHPRSRGVYRLIRVKARLIPGSSPLARGLLHLEIGRVVIHGIIPARAGFTRVTNQGRRFDWDHPRSRGVYVVRQSCLRLSGGSSPLARGLLEPAEAALRRERIIPARAGFTDPTGWPMAPAKDHPRSRGVYLQPRMGPRGRRGSSPLARGLRISRGIWQ